MRQIILTLCMLCFSQTSFSETLPFSDKFWDDNLQISHEGDKFKAGKYESAGHLGIHGHNVLYIFDKNPYLAYPNFNVGIIDNGIFEEHNDLLSMIHLIGQTGDDYHGTTVASLFSSSEIGNKKGTHGIINANTYYTDYTAKKLSTLKHYDNIEFAAGNKIKVITQSMALETKTSFAGFEGRNGDNPEWIGGPDTPETGVQTFGETEEIQRIKSVQSLRNHFIRNPDILYILAAGNSATDAAKNNGAIHYSYTEGINGNSPEIIFSPIQNVIVVAAVGFDEILHDYSDFGPSIDIAGISGLYAAAYVTDDGRHTYSKLSNGLTLYGISKGGSTDSKNSFNGTSAAAPVIAGLATVLMNMDPSLSPAQIKQHLINSHKTASSIYTGECVKDNCKTALLEDSEALKIKQLFGKTKKSIPIADLKASYDNLYETIKQDVQDDIQTLLLEYDHSGTCESSVNLLNKGENGSNKYEPLFYGNKCLYFRGNSFIIEYDISTKLAKSLYYGDAHYDEYQTVRKFINNMKSAKTDETWRQGYGVGLNTQGNVACLSADGSACTQPLTTPQQCENIWEALTGVLPSTIYFRKTYIKEGVCSYSQFERIIVNYNSNNNEINIYTGVNYYSSFPERLENLNQLEQVLDTLQSYRDNPFNCFFKLHDIFRDKIPPQLKIIQGYERRCAIIIHNGDIEDISDFSKVPHIYLSPRHGNSHDPIRLNKFDKWNQFALNKLNKLYPNGPDRSKTYRSIFDSICKEQTESSNQKLCKERSSRYQNIRFTYEHGIWFNALTYRISRGDATMYAQVRNNLYQ